MAAAEGEIVMAVERAKPTFSHRFSLLRFMRTVSKCNPIQRGYITGRNMGNMLHMPKHLMIRLDFLQWLVDHIEPNSGGVFVKKKKSIHFTKHIVDKVFGFESGTIPYALSSDDPAVVSEVRALRAQYQQGKRVPLLHLESILLGTNNEVVFVRTFIWYFISTVLCPGMANFADPKYLYALTDKDMHQVHNLDYGNLCIDNLFEEIDDWKERVFGSDGDYNKDLWIGGCLPLLAVVYMDFIKFDGNPGGFDYHLPRMTYIRNRDFKYLVNADINLQSRKQFGVLPFRRLHLTPYGDPDMLPGDIPEEEEEDEEEDVLNQEFVIEEQFLQLVNEHGVPDDNFDVNEDIDNHDNDIEMEEYDVHLAHANEEPAFNDEVANADNVVQMEEDHDQLHNVNEDVGLNHVLDNLVNQDVIQIDPEEIPDSSPPDVAGGSPDLPEGTQFDIGVADVSIHDTICGTSTTPGGGEYSTHMSDAYIPDAAQSEIGEYSTHLSDVDIPDAVQSEIGEGFVSSNCSSSSALSTLVFSNASSERLFDESSGQNSLDKKNRKKRAAKNLSPDTSMQMLRTSPDVDAFYTNFLRAKYFKQENSPTFVLIGRYSATYDSFHKSFKARGDLVDDTMCLYTLMYNEEAKSASLLKTRLNKVMFSPYVADKLKVDPSIFDKSFVVAEFARVSEDIDIGKIALMHFPSIVSNRWTLITANPLYNTINFFDPAGMIPENSQDELIHNLICNLKLFAKN